VDATAVMFPACPATDDPTIPNALLIMTNLSGQDWSDLYYVADPGTTISNIDGFATSAAAPGVTSAAMRIDMLGVNRSLVAESILNDGIFQAGETWEVLLQDYGNAAGFGPGEFGSLDFSGASGAAGGLSSGSIVSTIPAPGAATLAGLGGLGFLRRRR